MITNVSLTKSRVDEIIDALCPVFGSKAADIPLFDSEKHAYLVNQYHSPNGNRILTYVAVCDRFIVEFVLGHHYSMEYINSLRLLVPDGVNFKVVRTSKWDIKTHYCHDELHARTKEVLSLFIKSNIGNFPVSDEEMISAVDSMVNELFSLTVDFLDMGGRQILEAYCKESNVCKDFM